MPLLASIFFGFAPMFLFAAFVNWLDRYEKEPKLLLGAAFVWGVIVAGGGAYILNTIFQIGIYQVTGSETTAEFGTVSIVAPIIEEALKGLAILVVFLLFRKEFDSILDGIVYGSITAMGFAAIENVLYISRGYDESGWTGFWVLVVIRVVLVGWMHPFFTAFTGIGFALTRTSRNPLVKIFAIPAGYLIAVFTHSFHNSFSTLVGGGGGFVLGLIADYLGYALMFSFVIWMIFHERDILKRQLQEEVSSGLISRAQYDTAISFFQTTAHLSALTSGSFNKTKRFYQVLGELAHKKEQRDRIGEESGNTHIIEGYRTELTQLAPLAKT